MIFSSRNYAIGMAHFQIAGGLKSLLGLSAAFVVGVGAIIGLVLYNTNPAYIVPALKGLFTLFFVIEGFMLVLMGGFRIGGCIRTDIMTNMIESHRQMPITASRAVLGYMLGTTAHLMVLTVLNMLVLAALCVGARLKFDDFVMAQMVLAFFALFLWSFSAMSTFMVKQVAPLMVMAVMFGAMGSAFLRQYGILPGVSLLISPFLGESIFNLTGGMLGIREAYVVALTAQLAFSALFFVGACRRYRGTYLTTFNAPLGLGLALVWSLLSVVAIRYWPSILEAMMRFRGNQPEPHEQMIASLAVGAMLLIVPIHALGMWESRHKTGAWDRLGVLAAAVAIGGLILGAAKGDAYQRSVALAVLTVHVLTMYAAVRAFRIFTPVTQLVLMGTVVLSVWLVPLMLEAILANTFPLDVNGDPRDFSLLGANSPLGLLIKVWNNPAVRRPALLTGLGVQAVVAGGLWQLGSLLLRRNRGAVAAMAAA